MITVKELLEEIEKLREFNDIDDMEIRIVICDNNHTPEDWNDIYPAPYFTTGELYTVSIEGLTRRLVNDKWEFIEEPYIKLFGYER